MSESDRLSRRSFLGRTVAAGATGIAVSRSLGQTKQLKGNDRIRVGLIGAGGQANWHVGQLQKQPDCVITAVCDVWQERLDKTIAKCEGAKPYHDYRDLLADKNVDAVLIATTPHWHALQAIHACEAGKDLYVEKPMALSIAESFALLNAVKKHKRISQVGTQIHAGKPYHEAVDIIRSGVLGPINVARTFHVLNQGPEGIGNPPVGECPKGLDWDFWCGPRSLVPYHPLLAKDSYHHPSFMEHTGGWTPGMAPHIIDLPFWALELGYPTVTSSSGGRYIIKDCGDAYDTHEVLWQFPNFTLQWMTSLVNSYAFDFQGEPGTRRRRGIYFHGVNGTLLADYGFHKIVPEGDRTTTQPAVPQVIPDSPGHHREWLDCIRSRQQPSCHVGYHSKIDVAINLSLISLKLGRSVHFDPVEKRIVGDAEATKLAKPVYRKPWKFPEEYLS